MPSQCKIKISSYALHRKQSGSFKESDNFWKLNYVIECLTWERHLFFSLFNANSTSLSFKFLISWRFNEIILFDKIIHCYCSCWFIWFIFLFGTCINLFVVCCFLSFFLCPFITFFLLQQPSLFYCVFFNCLFFHVRSSHYTCRYSVQTI